MCTIGIISCLSVRVIPHILSCVSLLFLHSLRVKMADNIHFLGKDINGFCPVPACSVAAADNVADYTEWHS